MPLFPTAGQVLLSPPGLVCPATSITLAGLLEKNQLPS